MSIEDSAARKFIYQVQHAVLSRNEQRGYLVRTWLHKAFSCIKEVDEDSWEVLDRDEQEALTNFLVEDGFITPEEWPFSYIELRSLIERTVNPNTEVAHVYVCDGNGLLRILCIQPSGSVEIVFINQ